MPGKIFILKTKTKKYFYRLFQEGREKFSHQGHFKRKRKDLASGPERLQDLLDRSVPQVDQREFFCKEVKRFLGEQ